MTEKPNERPEEMKPEDATPVPEDSKPAENEQQKEELEQVDELEKESMYELETFREANNRANADAVNDAQESLKKIFDDMRKWIRENGDPEVLKERLEKGREDITRVMEDTKNNVIALANSEQFKKTVEAGRDFVVGTGTMIADGVKYGADQLMKNPTINKAVKDVDSKLDTLRQNENLKSAVDTAEDAVDKLNSAIFNGIRSFFGKHEDKPEAPAASETTASADVPAVRSEQRPAVTDQPDEKK